MIRSQGGGEINKKPGIEKRKVLVDKKTAVWPGLPNPLV